MNAALTTTAFTIDGHEIVRSLGVVRGITVRSRSIFGTIGGSLAFADPAAIYLVPGDPSASGGIDSNRAPC